MYCLTPTFVLKYQENTSGNISHITCITSIEGALVSNCFTVYILSYQLVSHMYKTKQNKTGEWQLSVLNELYA